MANNTSDSDLSAIPADRPSPSHPKERPAKERPEIDWSCYVAAVGFWGLQLINYVVAILLMALGVKLLSRGLEFVLAQPNLKSFIVWFMQNYGDLIGALQILLPRGDFWLSILHLLGGIALVLLSLPFIWTAGEGFCLTTAAALRRAGL